ncbi:MAG: iron ABC transporter permease [Marinobacter sp.]|uniref:FecCD family ABC transporter permease n=1 Tax=Marinobacter sp. TaxID=50741 RepID=UPI00299F0EAC|nr:iron ABC transporter permease [Marinobacter sp.]MDX1635430.1 iron ABC transporter permease [Marinobacter sp.]
MLMHSSRARSVGGAGCLLLLALAILGSLVLGQIPISLATLAESFTSFDPARVEHLVVRSERLTRTVVAMAIGASLAVAGVLIQSLTRNPLASPGILGINAGALFFVVLGFSLFSLLAPSQLIWLALAGAALAAVTVYGLGHEPGQGLSPIRTVLAGVAITALFVSFSQGLLILDQSRFESMLFWLAGSVSGRSLDAVLPLLPWMAGGVLVSLALARQLNLLGLDDDMIQGLGLNVARVRMICGALIILLAGAAVAIGGLIGFVGLMVPHIARGLFGTDHRWLLPAAALLGAILVLAADILARLIIPPREVPVGVVTALLGTPLFLHLARRSREMS